jgi:hypothetical protein
MAYATVQQLRAYLPQVESGDSVDAVLQDILERATSLVQHELSLALSFWHEHETAPAASTKTVFSEPSVWLKLPPYVVGSLTSLTAAGETTAITDYEERPEFGRGYLWREAGWAGRRYTVTAVFTAGAPPPVLVELVLEVAVNLYRMKDRGMFQEVQSQGVGITQLRFIGGMTEQQRRTAQQIRRAYFDGVY